MAADPELTAWLAGMRSAEYHDAYMRNMEASWKAAAEREQREAEERELQAVLEEMARAPVKGLQQMVDVLCRRHRITVRWTDGSAVPGVARAHANWRTRTITTPRIETTQDGATALHEIGHVLQGGCPNTPPHRRDARVTAWWNCLECERDASERALRLAPFTAAMHQELAQALRTSLATIASGQDVQGKARRFVSGVSWREDQQRRMDREIREMKIQQIQQWAREAGHGIS
jgi:hypothetical protein